VHRTFVDSIKGLNNRMNELGIIKVEHTNMSNDFTHFKEESKKNRDFM